MDLLAARAAQHPVQRAARPRPASSSSRRWAAAFTAVTRALLVHDHDAGAHRLEHGLGEPAALLQLLVLADEPGPRELDLLLAAGQPLGHAVEGGDQGPELLAARREVDAHARARPAAIRSAPSATRRRGVVMRRAR